MLVQGDLKCLHCGFISGQWVGEKGAPLAVSGIRPVTRPPGDPDAPVRCRRCDGPVYLEDASAVASSRRISRIRRLRAQLADIETAKRRPPRRREAA